MNACKLKMPGVNGIKQILMRPVFVVAVLAVIVTLQATTASGEGTKDSKATVQADTATGAVCILPPAQARMDYRKVDPKSVKAMPGIEKCVRQSGLEPSLLVLVKLRASQINGCDYCLDLHVKDAQSHGETEQRLSAVSAWRKTSLFSERERAALAWTEAVTRVADTHVPDDVHEVFRKQFTEKERVNLTLAIGAINGWNRLNIAFQTVLGS